MTRRGLAVVVLGAGIAAGACRQEPPAEPVFPDPDSVAAWFGEGTQVRLSGNVLEISGTMDPEFLRRGGSLWQQSGPYFYLFNVEVQELLTRYPDLAAVRAVTYDASGRELARATLPSRGLNEYEWREALARATLAQREGTRSPRRVRELIDFGEEHTEYSYRE